jgi:hypothetical protein
VIANAFRSYLVTPNGDFDNSDTFTILVGSSSATVTHVTNVATSLALFAGANSSIGGYSVVNNGDGTLTLFQNAANAATATVTAPISAAGTGASAATIGAAATVNTTSGVSATAAALPTASHSSFLVTGTGTNQVTTSAIDTIAYVSGDVIDFTNANISRASAVAAGNNNAGISNVGIATFQNAPGSLNDALTLIAAGINDGGTAAGEAVVFQFGGKTYVYISDGSNGHSAADVVIEITGAPATLTTGLTVVGGDITGLG